jgi:glycine cleavage system H protein
VVAINEALLDAPETVNDDPYGAGWMVKLRMLRPAEVEALLDETSYLRLIES